MLPASPSLWWRNQVGHDDMRSSTRDRKDTPDVVQRRSAVVIKSVAERVGEPVTRERILRALLVMAGIVSSPGGEKYLAIYQRLETELAAYDRAGDALMRAQELARRYAIPRPALATQPYALALDRHHS